MSLRRRIREAGLELDLPARTIRSLSAASYETARLLLTERSADAEVRLADGSSLQVVFHVRHDGPLTSLHERLVGPTARLSRMVEVEITDSGTQLSVSLRALCTARAGHCFEAAVVPGYALNVATNGDDTTAGNLGDLRKLNGQLLRSHAELRAELQETNRGVVALHAELEANAEKLRQAEDRLRLLLDSVQDYAICMLTPQGLITSWNLGAERLFGYNADEIIGRTFACFYPAAERDLELPVEHLRTAEEQGKHSSECLRIRRSGAAFDAHVIVTPVRGDRERLVRGFSLVVRDITERKRLEADLRRRAEELSAANRAKEDFLATLSHELRTPLNAMLGWTRLLRMGKLDGAAMTRALETIERNAHIQEQLIADILDVSRIVTGKLRLALRPIELAPVVDAALEAVRPAAAAKGIDLKADTDFSGTVLGDPDRLQQVVWNLIVNAMKFTPTAGEIALRLFREGPSAVVTVTDTGEGIAPELLPFIFDRFTQGDTSVTRPHGGLGLGLSIVRHIVELHGGKVKAHSDGRGRGAIFSVHLPVSALQQAAPDVAHLERLDAVKAV